MSRSKRLLGALRDPNDVSRLKAAPEAQWPTPEGMASSGVTLHDRALTQVHDPFLGPRRTASEGACVLRGSHSEFDRWTREARLPEMSNFCCLPGRAGGTPIILAQRAGWGKRLRDARRESILRIRCIRYEFIRSKAASGALGRCRPRHSRSPFVL